MKIKIAIISGIILAGIIFAAISIPVPVSDFSPMFGPKYQYTFGETTIKNEKDQQFDRVFFSYSHNFGKTFSELQDISMSENTWTGESKMILMDDSVILVWREEIIPTHMLAFATSDDHGKNLEKKYLWHGSRPDIVHYDDVLYLTWVDLETRQVLYTTSDDKGKTFADHKVIFAPTNEFSPYALKPEPKLVIEDEVVKIIWDSSVSKNSDPQHFEYVVEKKLKVDTQDSDSQISDLVVTRDNNGNLMQSVCPIGQNYNEVLFKCVVSCEDDLVYNGYTDSCTTHFERKYHGFCNEGFTYQPLTHTCLAENNPDDGIGDLEHIPLKDPPRTAPPEPTIEEVSSIPSAQEFLQMNCQDLNRHYPEFPSEEVANAWITRMHQCLNELENEN